MARTVLPLCLLLAAALRGGLTQAPGPLTRPGPLLLRLRRLEEQEGAPAPEGIQHFGPFHRLQEVTLSHLQSIAGNYISYNIDGRFQALAQQTEVATAARAALCAELARLTTTSWRLHCGLKRLEGTVGALSPPDHPLTYSLGAVVEAGTKPPSLLNAAQSWGNQPEREPRGWVAPSTPSPQHLKTRQWQQHQQVEGHRLPTDASPSGAPKEDAESPRNAELGAQALTLVVPTVTAVPQKQPPNLQQPGEGTYVLPTPAPTSLACRSVPILLFPNASTKHMAIVGLGPYWGLRALSICSWLATPAPHLGALLSYVTKDGVTELAMRGHGGDLPGSVHFIIGDGQFRELPVMPLLDGKWHHLCITWSSGQGQYRFYVDRRLLAAGSGVQQGYEIPAGGSLVLGCEQHHPSRDFGATEAFVGQLAGFALWRRALLPGEVASMVTGQGLPHGPLLTLADASLLGGVWSVACSYLQYCL